MSISRGIASPSGTTSISHCPDTESRNSRDSVPRDTVHPTKHECFQNVALSIHPDHGFHFTSMWIPLPGNLLEIQALNPLDTPVILHTRSSSSTSLSSCHRPENSLLFFLKQKRKHHLPGQMWRRERPEVSFCCCIVSFSLQKWVGFFLCLLGLAPSLPLGCFWSFTDGKCQAPGHRDAGR